MVTTAITIDADSVNANFDDREVILTGVDIDNIVGEFSMEEWVNAATDHFDFGTVLDYLVQRKAEDEA